MQDPYLDLALSLAESVKGQTSPNPPVGAVVVKDGRIIGSGAHLKAGGPHAEVHALREAGEAARGADIYVTLEPCNHTGKTPPCTEQVISAGIRKVIVGTTDPNPAVSGRGITRLKEAGIEVEIVNSERARKVIEPFVHFIKTGTPFTTIKSAVTADGKTAAHTGHSRWITGEEAREDVHRLRSCHDAILTGIGTILHDNPLLTSRLPRGGKHPIRVILDTELKTPADFNIIQNNDAETIVVCGSGASETHERQLAEAGAEVLRMPTTDIRIPELLELLGERGIMTLFVEAGGEVNASFIEAGAFNELIVYMAPKMIGGKSAPTLSGGAGFPTMDESINLQFESVEMLGRDIKITASRKEG